MKKSFLTAFFMALLAGTCLQAQTQSQYGLPKDIQDGNILHCFNWPLATVEANLQSIAEAGFGAVQVSPLQRKSVVGSTVWYDLYRPYDYAFQSTSGMGSAEALSSLCNEAKKYGIKVIVDVVANHVDKSSGYHDPWWDSNTDYVRSKGGSANINYGNRKSITHDRLGDYYELNTENPEVIARAKAYIQQLHDLGVSGIRFDAAKHIELPSEGSQFWAEVTSVPDMFYYGEILGSPGGNSSTVISEYAQYMSVTDSEYSDGAAKSNGGIPRSALGSWASNTNVGPAKVVLWGESHDTYSNTPDGGGWSTNINQRVIDRAYASMACRQGSTALYLARPSTAGFGNIKIGKGTDAFKSKAIKEVNRFRNNMGDSPESFSYNSDKSACSITRGDKGAVIVMKTSGKVTVPNGNSYLPAGKYIDRVSGVNEFTVTNNTIEGEVGPTGIVVLYNDDTIPVEKDETDYSAEKNITVYFDNSVTNWNAVNIHYWGGMTETGWPGVPMKSGGNNIYVAEIPAGSSVVFNNGNNSNTLQTNNVENVEDGHIYKPVSNSNKADCTDEGLFDGDIEVDPDDYIIYYDNTLSKWTDVYCYYWGGASSSWPGDPMEPVEGENEIYTITLPKNCQVVFNNKNNGKQSEDVKEIKHKHVYQVQSDSNGRNVAVDLGIFTSSGIQDIITNPDTNYTLSCYPGLVKISTIPGTQIILVDILGRIHYQGKTISEQTEVSLSPGMYVVNVGNKASKIVIK